MSRMSWLTIVTVFVCSFILSVQAVHTQGRGQGRGVALVLPDGPGKETLQSQCTKCHALGLIASSGGYTRQGWEELFSTMVVLPNDQKAQVADRTRLRQRTTIEHSL